jgi:hypothetical protein
MKIPSRILRYFLAAFRTQSILCIPQVQQPISSSETFLHRQAKPSFKVRLKFRVVRVCRPLDFDVAFDGCVTG